MQLAARWVVLVAALAGAAVLNLDVDDAMLSLEADDATDIDAYVASLSLPRLEGAGCAANDAPCVRKVVADALRAAVEDEAFFRALRIEEAGAVAQTVEPFFVIGLGGLFRILVIAGRDAIAAHAHFHLLPDGGELQFDAGKRKAEKTRVPLFFALLSAPVDISEERNLDLGGAVRAIASTICDTSASSR